MCQINDISIVCLTALLTAIKTSKFQIIWPFANVINDDVIKWKHFPRYWSFVRRIHWSPVNSLHKGQWCGALMFSLINAWINDWINSRDAGDLRRHRAHYDVIVMRGDWYIPLTKGKRKVFSCHDFNMALLQFTTATFLIHCCRDMCEIEIP